MNMTSKQQARWDQAMMANYGTPPIALAYGKGCYVVDADGREYLDLLAGIAVSTLGHGHPAIAEAVARQATQLVHTSNLYMHEPGLELAERLIDLLDMPAKVFFSQDGATANEAAFKIARRHGWTADPSGGRLRIIAADRSFHGRTMGALSVTGNAAKREPFEPLPEPVTFVPYGDAASMAQQLDQSVAAVFLEPVLGEGGVVPPPANYLAEVRRLCDKVGALLVIDEVQSGIGRTGDWFASTGQGVRPDVITLAKGLAGGLPLGACIATGSTADLFRPGDHGTTFGGNPISCAAALAVLDTIEKDKLLNSVNTVGDALAAAISAMSDPWLVGQRGVGLWRAIELNEPQSAVVERVAREQGFLVNAVRPDVIRLAPPLILTEKEARTFTDALPGILEQARGESG